MPVSGADVTLPCSIAGAGRYVVRLYADGAADNANTYTLQVTYP
jgi:hypothetical protein